MCDQPHPTTVRKCVQACMDGDADTAFHALHSLWAQGYSALDLVGTLFRVGACAAAGLRACLCAGARVLARVGGRACWRVWARTPPTNPPPPPPNR